VLFVLADVSAPELRKACGEDPSAICRWVFERTESRTLADAAQWVIGTPLTILLIAIGALLVNRVIARVIQRAMRSVSNGIARERLGAARRRAPGALLETATATSLRAEQRIDALTSILRSVAGFVILLFACFMVLSEVGVDVAPLLAGAGVVGVALGFGSQSLVKDFLSGMFILAEDQFGVGDVVDLDGQATGAVEAVSLRTTRLRAADGTVWHVPNGAIIRVGNKSQHWARALVDVELAGDTDIDHAEHVINRVAKDLDGAREDIFEQPEVRGIEKRDDGRLVFRLLVKTLPADRDEVIEELRRRLAAQFAREGIEHAGGSPGTEHAAVSPGPARAGSPDPAHAGGSPDPAHAGGLPDPERAGGSPDPEPKDPR
jgi:small-conductance mechanosensitive channel